VLQTAVLHVQSAQRQEAQVGDILAALLQQPKSHAASLLAEQGVTRLDVLEYISHGITKTPIDEPADSPSGGAEAGTGDEGSSTSKDPLSAYCTNLTARARQGTLRRDAGGVRRIERRTGLRIAACAGGPGRRA